MKQYIFIFPLLVFASLHCGNGSDNGHPVQTAQEIQLRFMTWNIEDIRTSDLVGEPKQRLINAARVIQELQPDVLLINEMSYDMAGVPGYNVDEGPGANVRRFADRYIAQQWSDSLQPLRYSGWMPPTNTGIASGYDLDNNGEAVTTFPEVDESDDMGAPPRQTAPGRAFGNDAWGFGTFPGQYGMALLVRDGLEIDEENIQSFQTLRWATLDSAAVPTDPGGTRWYSDAEWANMRLSSKNHVVIPVSLPDGRRVSVLASHPTPPAFDGDEMRNKKRNHDEIRLLAEIVAGNESVLSDQGTASTLSDQPYFVIMGDLNADIDEGNAYQNPIARFIYGNERLNTSFSPVAPDSMLQSQSRLDPDDTASWGLRADYVIPSVDLQVVGSGVYRTRDDDVEVSDHFPVWVDLIVPVIQVDESADE